MVELFGRSLARSWSEQGFRCAPGARRKVLAGTMLYGIGVLLESPQSVVRFPRFFHTGEVVGILMLAGLAAQICGIVAHYHDSAGPMEGLRAVNAKQ